MCYRQQMTETEECIQLHVHVKRPILCWVWHLSCCVGGNGSTTVVVCFRVAVVHSSARWCRSAITQRQSHRSNGIPTTARSSPSPQPTTDSPSGTLPSNRMRFRQRRRVTRGAGVTVVQPQPSCCLFMRDRRRSKSCTGTRSSPVSSSALQTMLSTSSELSARDTCFYARIYWLWGKGMPV